MPGQELTAVDLEIEETGSFFRMALPGGRAREGSLDYLLSEFQLALWSLNQVEMTGSPALHAASVTRGQRGVFVGDAGCGKTTLVLRLIGEGFAVEGDALVVVGQGWTFALPRRLHVRDGSLPLASRSRRGDRGLPGDPGLGWPDDPFGRSGDGPAHLADRAGAGRSSDLHRAEPRRRRGHGRAHARPGLRAAGRQGLHAAIRQGGSGRPPAHARARRPLLETAARRSRARRLAPEPAFR